MTDNESEETVELSEDHPWVAAALTGAHPGPIPTSMKLDAIQFQDGTKAAMLSIITPLGVFNPIIGPELLQSLMMQAGGIMQSWQQEDSNRLIVADKNTERAVTEQARAAQEAERIFRR